jgi:beta,beta-carotene 9',10'-dioxygenase
MTEQLFQIGFTNLDRESDGISLQVEGRIPSWLSGTLFRNGPAKFNTESGWHTHWFDGLAMIHKFTVHDGYILYSNRFLRTKAYELAMTTGEMSSGFATAGGKSVQGANNTNVSVSKIDGRFVALTESPGVIEFDPHSLETKGVFDFGDAFQGHLTTAHPHFDLFSKRYLNFTVQFGQTSTYNLYSIAPESRKREMLCAVPTSEPAYIHSFANTKHFVILAEYPFVANPIQLMTSGKPFIDNFQWKPAQGTKFYVVRKSDGRLYKTFEAEAFFSFHHVNAFEVDDGLILDVCATCNANIVGGLQVDQLTNEKSFERNPVQFRRYRLPFSSTYASYETLSPESIDLPAVNIPNTAGARTVMPMEFPPVMPNRRNTRTNWSRSISMRGPRRSGAKQLAIPANLFSLHLLTLLRKMKVFCYPLCWTVRKDSRSSWCLMPKRWRKLEERLSLIIFLLASTACLRKNCSNRDFKGA